MRVKVWYHGFLYGHAVLSYTCPMCLRVIVPDGREHIPCPRCGQMIELSDSYKPNTGREVI